MKTTNGGKFLTVKYTETGFMSIGSFCELVVVFIVVVVVILVVVLL